MLFTEEIVLQADTMSQVTLSNLWSITLSNIKSMALVADNITCNALIVKLDEDNVNKEPLKIIAINDVVVIVAAKESAALIN